eukprot:5412679-Amphidinium_carterae.1
MSFLGPGCNKRVDSLAGSEQCSAEFLSKFFRPGNGAGDILDEYPDSPDGLWMQRIGAHHITSSCAWSTVSMACFGALRMPDLKRRV